MSNGQKGGRAEGKGEQAGVEGPKIETCVSDSASFTSRLSGTAGLWGNWLLNSASGFVAELGAESEGTKNDLKEFCHVIVSDSTEWLRGRTTRGSPSNSASGSSSSCCLPGTELSSRCLPGEDNSDPQSALPEAPVGANNLESSNGGLWGPPGARKADETEQRNSSSWRKDPNLYQHFLAIVKSDTTFLSSPPLDLPTFGGDSGQEQQQGDCNSSCRGTARHVSGEGELFSSVFATPSEQEIEEYSQDPNVSAAFGRLVPEEVAAELFWKRLHTRVCLMIEREEHVAVHLKKLRSAVEAEDASESEEDITWEDLGNDDR